MTSSASTRSRCRAATAHVLAAPCELAHGPLLDQAMVAPMVPGIAVVWQGGRWWGRRWRRRGRAGLALRRAAKGLLALRPAPLPVREAFVAIIVARGCRAADMVVSAAPTLLAHLPGHRGADGAVRLRWRGGRWRRSWGSVRGTPNAVVPTAPRLLVQGPEPVALTAVRLGG